MQLQGNGTQQGAGVGNGLGHLNAQYIKHQRQQQNGGDEEQTLAGNGHKGGRYGFSGNLLHHVAHDDPALSAEADTLKTQSDGTDFDDIGIVTE